MKLISKLSYQARIKGLDVTKSDGVKIKNSITKRYIHILPNGRICSEDTLGQDRALKELMKDFLIKDPFSGSSICIPCTVTLHVGNGALTNDIRFAKHCLEQSFANIKNFIVVEDETLLPHECRIDHEFVLSYKKRQAFIDACLDYLI